MASIKKSNFIKLSKSSIGRAEKNAVLEVLDLEYLGMGREVEKFERALSEYFQRKVICVSSGTAALQLALESLGFEKGFEVLVPTVTYVATFQAVIASGGIPVACDIDPLTMLLDLDSADRRKTAKTKVIIPVHYGGDASNLDKIYQFAQKNELRVVEDAAHAFGGSHKNLKIGSFGDIACFSFDGIKNITAGEGGCVVTNDKKVSDYVADARLLGVSGDTERRYSGQRSWQFDVVDRGWRYHMSNIMAAIGIEQLKKITVIARKRRNLATLYDALLKNNPFIVPFSRNYECVLPHIYAVRIPGLRDRSLLQKKLLDLGIQTGVHYQPNHFLTIYKNIEKVSLLEAEKVCEEIISLPLHCDLKRDDIRYVVKSIKEELKKLNNSEFNIT